MTITKRHVWTAVLFVLGGFFVYHYIQGDQTPLERMVFYFFLYTSWLSSEKAFKDD